ncbi:MAG UNVERIFIED_CONTAM: hypothetical protein LVR29_07070 [Microcystis novacekii LVE1205-3]|jgi:hypothetical protein
MGKIWIGVNQKCVLILLALLGDSEGAYCLVFGESLWIYRTFLPQPKPGLINVLVEITGGSRE